jgi:hypothetical protein
MAIAFTCRGTKKNELTSYIESLINLYQLEKYLLQIRSPQPPLLRGARGDR